MRWEAQNAPLWTWAKQHDDQVDSSANASPQLHQVQFSPPQRRTPQAKPMAPRQTLPHTNTGHPPRYPSHSSHPNGSGGIHIGTLTRNTRTPAGSPTPAFTFGLFSSRSWACSRPRRTCWTIVAPPPLRHILQLPREFEPRVHGYGVGIRGSAAQRASSTHSTASGAELYFWNECSRPTGSD